MLNKKSEKYGMIFCLAYSIHLLQQTIHEQYSKALFKEKQDNNNGPNKGANVGHTLIRQPKT
jgi:hypothetical protein